MVRWGSVLGVATAVAMLLLPPVGVSAEDSIRPPKLLSLDGPKVDLFVLDQENLSGMGLAGGSFFGQPMEFGVILWDELKPERPSPASPQPTSLGGGNTVVSGSVR